nr:EAL domain-containing protein [Kineosporia mesophila]
MRAVVAGVTGAAIGLIPVISVSRGEPLLTVAAIGPGLVLGLHAFATLSERHTRLSRLYELSEALAHVPAPARAIPLVLEQSADLLRARYSELVLNDDLGRSTSGRRLWSHRSGHVIGPRTPADDLFPLPWPPESGQLVRGRDRAERDFLRARGLGQAVLVPLRIDDTVAGHLLVGERSGGEHGFAASDLATLQTVAARAAVALSNGHLVERLRFEARHDELTGLPNRLDFRAQLDAWVPELVSGDRSCAVMLLDLNGFKAINDTLGHQAGDQLLRELAGRLGRVAGRGTTIARLGGDEFAVLAPGLGDGAARALARRLLTAFDEPVTLEGQELRVGGSLGVAVGPDQGTTGAELLRRADVAMYVAKSAGGGYRMFTRSMDLPASQLQTLATALEEALLQDSIGIAVLPVVDLVTGRAHALEALARWNHPELGEVPPEDFFAAAERSGLVTELSRRVLDQALAAARDWLEKGQQVRVAVNLAPGWLADPTLPEQITTALAVHDLPPDLLYLEVTEADVIDEPDTHQGVLASLTRLRALGVRLSVDDFGTGYSSLTFLSRLPVSQVKIHQSLVQELRAGGTGRAVVQSIIDLGRNLGLEVVAEGVTDAHTRIELKRMGCGFGQGYYFNAPVAVGDLAWAAGHRPPGTVTLPPAPRVVGTLDTLDECSPQTAPPSAP